MAATGPFAGLMTLAMAPAPAAVMPANSWFGGATNLIADQQPSSTSGVPQNVTTATQGAGTVGGLLGWASLKNTGSIWSNPAFLAVLALAISVIMLGHVAHVQIG